MAENVLESGPPSAKRPKLSSPALSASASDGNGKYLFCLIFTTLRYLNRCLLVFYVPVHTEVFKRGMGFSFFSFMSG